MLNIAVMLMGVGVLVSFLFFFFDFVFLLSFFLWKCLRLGYCRFWGVCSFGFCWFLWLFEFLGFVFDFFFR